VQPEQEARDAWVKLIVDQQPRISMPADGHLQQ